MSQRPVHIPLSGRDRRAFLRELKTARGAAVMADQEGDALLGRALEHRRQARELAVLGFRKKCEAMNARLFYGGSIQPSPTIAQALFCGYDILETRCNRCGASTAVPLDTIRTAAKTEIWRLEESAALRCEPCSESKGWKQRLQIVCVRPALPLDGPDHPAPTAQRIR
jgi:hypothetical protein